MMAWVVAAIGVVCLFLVRGAKTEPASTSDVRTAEVPDWGAHQSIFTSQFLLIFDLYAGMLLVLAVPIFMMRAPADRTSVSPSVG